MAGWDSAACDGDALLVHGDTQVKAITKVLGRLMTWRHWSWRQRQIGWLKRSCRQWCAPGLKSHWGSLQACTYTKSSLRCGFKWATRRSSKLNDLVPQGHCKLIMCRCSRSRGKKKATQWASNKKYLESKLRYLLSAMVVKWGSKHQVWRRWRCSHKVVSELVWWKEKLLSLASEDSSGEMKRPLLTILNKGVNLNLSL